MDHVGRSVWPELADSYSDDALRRVTSSEAGAAGLAENYAGLQIGF